MGYTIQVPSQLSSHLRALRKAKGLSQADLGARLGLSQTRLARIEGDPLAISVEQLLRVLSVLGVRVTLDVLPTIHGASDKTIHLSGTSTGAVGGAPVKPNDDEAW